MMGCDVLSLSVAVLLSLLCTGNCFNLDAHRHQGFINHVTLRCLDNQGKLSNHFFLDGVDLKSRVDTLLVNQTLNFNTRRSVEHWTRALTALGKVN